MVPCCYVFGWTILRPVRACVRCCCLWGGSEVDGRCSTVTPATCTTNQRLPRAQMEDPKDLVIVIVSVTQGT